MRGFGRADVNRYQLRYAQRAEAVTKEVHDAMVNVRTAAIKEAHSLSSGPYSLKQLRRIGHPYARRAPRPVGVDFPGRINLQTGKFRSSWRAKIRDNRKSVSVRLWNTDPKAKKFLTGAGTKKMVGRPIVGMLAKRLHPVQKKETRNAQKAFIGAPVVAKIAAPAAATTGGGGFPNLGGAFRRGFQRNG